MALEDLQFPLRSGAIWQGSPDFWDMIKMAYPQLNIQAECQKMIIWLTANPKRRKTSSGMERFIVNWLNRAMAGRYAKEVILQAMRKSPLETVATIAGYQIPRAAFCSPTSKKGWMTKTIKDAMRQYGHTLPPEVAEDLAEVARYLKLNFDEIYDNIKRCRKREDSNVKGS